MTDDGKTYSNLDAELRLRELERAVVEAAKAWVGDDVDAGYKLWEAVRALDAAERPNA